MNDLLKEQLMKYVQMNNVYDKTKKRHIEAVIIRGDIFYADLGNPKGSIQGGIRPVIVISNDMCNEHSSVITVAPITSKLNKNQLPTHVLMNNIALKTISIVLGEGTTSINISDLKEKIGHCTNEEMIKVDEAIAIQCGLKNNKYSTEEKFNKEVFDIYKVQKIVKNIKELDIFIKKFDNPMVQPIKDSRETLLLELQDYCNKFNKNVNLFYKGVEKTNNRIDKYIRKMAINNTNKKREVLAIG